MSVARHAARKPDHEATSSKSLGSVRHKKLLRVWKIVPGVAAFELDGGIFGVFIAKGTSHGVPREEVPPQFGVRDGVWFEEGDLAVLAQHHPRWVQELVRATGRPVDTSKLPYWLRARQVANGTAPMEHRFDAEAWLGKNGWRGKKDQYKKRFGGEWVTALVGSASIIFHAAFPKGMSMDEFQAWRDEVGEQLTFKGKYGTDIEAAAARVAALAKAKRPAPRRKVLDEDTKAQIAAFSRRVEDVVQEELGQGETTKEIVSLLFGNGGWELHNMLPYTVSRRDAGKLVRKVLDSMAKRGLLEKDTGDRVPRWFKGPAARVASRWLSRETS